MKGQRASVSPPPPLAAWVPDERPVAPAPSSSPDAPRERYQLPGDVQAEVRKAVTGTAYQREKAVTNLTKAAEAYDRHRYEEALRLARSVTEVAPGVAPVRELAGLAAYRAQRWPMARGHLNAYFELTGDAQHLPLVMDSDRAQRKFRAVARTFETVLSSEPSPDVLAEARIVMAGALADQAKFTDAIDLLVRAGATKTLRNPAYRHVRLWYAMGDVSDRAGDAPTAREFFARVVAVDPDAYDARQRLDDLGLPVVRKNRKRRTTPVSKKRQAP